VAEVFGAFFLSFFLFVDEEEARETFEAGFAGGDDDSNAEEEAEVSKSVVSEPLSWTSPAMSI
jgi:hypothetical protein